MASGGVRGGGVGVEGEREDGKATGKVYEVGSGGG